MAIDSIEQAAVILTGEVWTTYGFLWRSGAAIAVTKGRDGLLHPMTIGHAMGRTVEDFRHFVSQGTWSRVENLHSIPRDVLLSAHGNKCPDELFSGVMQALLFTETDESDETGGEPLDYNYGPEDFDPETVASICIECAAFWHKAQDTVPNVAHKGVPGDQCIEQVGIDFVMSRNGHGCGFWEPDWQPEPKGEYLDEVAKAFGEIDIEVGDDNLLYRL